MVGGRGAQDLGVDAVSENQTLILMAAIVVCLLIIPLLALAARVLWLGVP